MIEDQLRLAFEFASDLAKQLITLATGVLALSITFVKEILQRQSLLDNPGRLRTLGAAWIMMFLSIFFGIWTLSALTGSLAPISGSTAPSLEGNSRFPAGGQVISFLLGIGLLIWFGISSLRKRQD